ncbi:MAG: hypothetical protein DI538_25540 [Azospira oryzae]|nr:MAG: hypothetical protein DI538_25540 [Azospira oryzae]
MELYKVIKFVSTMQIMSLSTADFTRLPFSDKDNYSDSDFSWLNLHTFTPSLVQMPLWAVNKEKMFQWCGYLDTGLESIADNK